ncbi:MAG: bifunctional diaminohydroxyphosphoribosylaminopyrimidine deaminase/5-amino-6-(5-phosphoribosylamino)uracil reductase RibD [Pseudomonadota bacterium]
MASGGADQIAERAADARWMRMALALAARRVGLVAPNPAVAALLVREGRLLGRGVTAMGGRPHAETEALAMAGRLGASVAGATAYVTLEPCAHHGLTPPCADALARAKIARLVCPLEDPDPRVAGRGFAMLRDAGVVVETGVLAAEARRVNAGFLSRLERGRPHLTLKLATSLDGRIATAAGESRWITGEAARRRVHLMRLRADAVMVGAGTARVDDPALTVRGFGEGARSPLRIVIDPRLTLPPAGTLVRSARETPVLAVHGDGVAEAATARLADAGVRLLRCPYLDADAAPERPPLGSVGHGASQAAALTTPMAAEAARETLDLRWMLDALGAEGIGTVFCEGGAGLAAALLRADLVDRLVVFSAGLALGAEGHAGLGSLGIDPLAAAPRFTLAQTETVGGDVMAAWERAPRPPTE